MSHKSVLTTGSVNKEGFAVSFFKEINECSQAGNGGCASSASTLWVASSAGASPDMNSVLMEGLVFVTS